MAVVDPYFWKKGLEFADAENDFHMQKSEVKGEYWFELMDFYEAERSLHLSLVKSEPPSPKRTKKLVQKKTPPTPRAIEPPTATPTITDTAIDNNLTNNTNIECKNKPQNEVQCSLAKEVAKARAHIKKSLECMDTVLASVPNASTDKSLKKFESDISQLRDEFVSLKMVVLDLQAEIKELKAQRTAIPQIAICPMKRPEPVPPKPASKDDDDDGVDLFGSDSEDDAEAAKIREERLAAYAAKKSKKPALIAKSNIILDCKPWDDETDMKLMEEKVRSIVADGLLWGASKLVPLAYGIQKLQISCVVEDDKISVDWLQEEIQNFEDFVQSVDIAAFNKI